MFHRVTQRNGQEIRGLPPPGDPFADARRDAEKGGIVYLASYPRSGNTFSRVLLGNYATGDEALDLNELEQAIPADTTDFLWRGVPHYDAQEISARNHWTYRRQIIEAYRRQPAPLPFRGLKTHTANLSTFGAPAFDLRPEDRIVYLARHPLDVALSNADYNDQDLDVSIDLMCRPGTCVGGKTLGSIEVRGSWPEHVAGWLNATACPVLLVRYEDLLGDTAAMLGRIATFIGLPVDEDRIAGAVERSGFRHLQRQEREGGFQEAPAKTRSGRFFREGRAGQWRTEMSPAQIERLSAYCADTLKRLGYPDPREEIRA